MPPGVEHQMMDDDMMGLGPDHRLDAFGRLLLILFDVSRQHLPEQRRRSEPVSADAEIAGTESAREVVQRAFASGVESSDLDDVRKLDVVGEVRAAIPTDADPRGRIAWELVQKSREFRRACSRDVAFAGYARLGHGVLTARVLRRDLTLDESRPLAA